jgi:hypothetical protein
MGSEMANITSGANVLKGRGAGEMTRRAALMDAIFFFFLLDVNAGLCNTLVPSIDEGVRLRKGVENRKSCCLVLCNGHFL